MLLRTRQGGVLAALLASSSVIGCSLGGVSVALMPAHCLSSALGLCWLMAGVRGRFGSGSELCSGASPGETVCFQSGSIQ